MTATVIPMHPLHRAPTPQAFQIHAYVAALLEAANSLLRDGHVVVAFQGDAMTPRPALWLAATPKLAGLAADGLASYERAGTDEHGPYRIGAFERCGVSVRWFERLPA